MSIPFADYVAIDAVNWSTLKHAARSMRHYHHERQTERPDTVRLSRGRAGHTAVLEPDRFLLDYVLWDGGDRRAKGYKAFAAEAEDAGKTVLTVAEYTSALALRDAVHAHPVAGPLLARKGESEVTVTWTDSETGLACKGRIDRLVTGGRPTIADFKTTSDIDARVFARVCSRLRYVSQLGMYRDGVRAARGLECGAAIIAAEVDEPYDVAVFRITSDALWSGSDEFHYLLARVAECEASGEWPGRYPERVDLELPPWTFEGELSDEIEVLS